MPQSSQNAPQPAATARPASFFNPCVVQHGAYTVAQYDEFSFAVLEPNPDAGRAGVVYAGDRLRVCNTDGVEDASRIARALALLAEHDAAAAKEAA